MTTDTPPRFEDRLLAQILENYDELATPAATPVTRRRSRARWAVPAFGAAAVAAAAAVVAVIGSGESVRHTAPVAHRVAIKTTNAHAAPAPSGRYVILSELDSQSDEPGQSRRTSVDDSQPEASVTYQMPYSDSNAPSKVVNGADPQQTAAYYASLPTDPTALRAQLLTIARRQQAQAQAFFAHQPQVKGLSRALTKQPAVPEIRDDDLVYETADDMLWSPLVTPQLRSALYQCSPRRAATRSTRTPPTPRGARPSR